MIVTNSGFSGSGFLKRQSSIWQNETVGHNETVVLLWVLVSTRTWVCKIYISSRELETILLNRKQEKYQKEAMILIKIDIFDVRSAYF